MVKKREREKKMRWFKWTRAMRKILFKKIISTHYGLRARRHNACTGNERQRWERKKNLDYFWTIQTENRHPLCVRCFSLSLSLWCVVWSLCARIASQIDKKHVFFSWVKRNGREFIIIKTHLNWFSCRFVFPSLFVSLLLFVFSVFTFHLYGNRVRQSIFHVMRSNFNNQAETSQIDSNRVKLRQIRVGVKKSSKMSCLLQSTPHIQLIRRNGNKLFSHF